jgi:hypothetical protein
MKEPIKRTAGNMVRKRDWILTQMEREHAAGRTKRGKRALKERAMQAFC